MNTDSAKSAARVDRFVSQFLGDGPDLVAVEWVDAFGCPAGWEFEDEVEPAVTTVKTVGFLLKETDDFLFLVPHISTTNGRRQLAGHLAVPKLQIVQRCLVTSFSCPDAE